jgi:hypothetical protein
MSKKPRYVLYLALVYVLLCTGIVAKDIGIQHSPYIITIWTVLGIPILVGIPVLLGYLAGMEAREHIEINYYQNRESLNTATKLNEKHQ